MSSGSNPGKKLLRDELRRRVLWALDELPPGYREVLVMRHLEELSVNEIAAVLGIPEGTVKSRHFRALERIRHLLNEDLAE
ncbi:MAG: sigma-70 family RNA polymerase sigma factor [Planctomycetes bacterium]|nr:sigma-70 family RNA polymerase sigma factor [Planctomycetota bacterium]